MRICTIKGLSMPMSLLTYFPSIVAFAHVQQSASDYFEVKNEFGKPFSSVLEQVLSSGGRQTVAEI